MEDELVLVVLLRHNVAVFLLPAFGLYFHFMPA